MKRALLLGCMLIIAIAGMSRAQPEQYQQYIIDGKALVTESFFDRFLKMLPLSKEPFRESYAIIIAIGEYENIKPLASSRQDARKMLDVLRRSGEYDEIVLLQDEEASFENIRYFMQSYFPGKMRERGRYRFLFYFTGHGGQYEGYGSNIVGLLLLKGAKNRIDDSESIGMDQLVSWANRFQNASHTLFVLDCCFSGLAGTVQKGGYDTRVNPLDLAEENGRYMITAGSAEEISIANLNRWGGSLFTEVLVSGMQGYADFDRDGVVTTYELFNYVQSAVRNQAKSEGHTQTPLISNLGMAHKDRGQYFFVYRDPDSPAIETASSEDTTSKAPSPQPTATPAPQGPKAGDEWTELVTGMEFVWVEGGCFQMG